jgi:hypothetical protein
MIWLNINLFISESTPCEEFFYKNTLLGIRVLTYKIKKPIGGFFILTKINLEKEK